MTDIRPQLEAFWAILILVLAIGPVGIGLISYNRLIGLRRGLRATWSDLDARLRDRHALARSIAEATKQELQALIDRCAAGDSSIKARAANEAVLTAQLHALSDTLSPELREKLHAAEQAIHEAQTAFNKTVDAYERTRRSFPGSIPAGIFGFGSADRFDADRSCTEPPHKV